MHTKQTKGVLDNLKKQAGCNNVQSNKYPSRLSSEQKIQAENTKRWYPI